MAGTRPTCVDRCAQQLTALVVIFIAVTPARSFDANVCRELERNYEQMQSNASSLQTNALLFTATEKACTPFVRRLLAAGASLEARDRLGNRPLAQAARWGQLGLVDLFLELGAAVDARNIAGSTALYLAAENDRLAVVRRLLERGADPNLAGRTGVTALSAAAFKGSIRIVEHLLTRGADAAQMDATGKAPIVYAAGFGFTAIVRRLVDAGVDVHARYGHGLTALMWASGYSDGAGVRDAESVVTLLIERGARLDDTDDRGRTALMIAAEAGHGAIVALLRAHGADRTLKDKDGKMAIDLASDESVREQLTR